jgi:hypothetical protein
LRWLKKERKEAAVPLAASRSALQSKGRPLLVPVHPPPDAGDPGSDKDEEAAQRATDDREAGSGKYRSERSAGRGFAQDAT